VGKLLQEISFDVVHHYRRLPLLWTAVVILLLLAVSNAFLRYDFWVHPGGHYTKVHDKLLETWRTYDWPPCPPPGDDESPP
jgi:hypothetical protein